MIKGFNEAAVMLVRSSAEKANSYCCSCCCKTRGSMQQKGSDARGTSNARLETRGARELAMDGDEI